MSQVVIKAELELNYTDYNYYFHEFIDSGGSGEVFLVEDADTGKGLIAKRYFKERPKDFR
jgi:hypothetical protein